MKGKPHEAVREMEWLRLNNELLSEGNNKTEASEVTNKY
jgi:hypothetical protein